METKAPPPRSAPWIAGGRGHLLYNALLLPLLLTGAPLWVPWVLAAPRRRRNLRERLGRGLGTLPPRSPRPRVWVHAVSVGESLAAAPFIPRLREKIPDAEVLVSTVTLTGQDVAGKVLGPFVDGRFFFPFDLPWTCAAFLDRIRPDAVVVLETEIWPNFIAACRARRIPVAILNGRISEGSFRGYRHLRRLFGPVLGALAAFSAQTEEDARRAVALGADPATVIVGGNMKFDVDPPAGDPSPLAAWMARAKGVGARFVVAGSTHEGEERDVLRAFGAARAVDGSVRLVLAPRHPERFDAVATFCGEEGFPPVRRSRLGEGGGGDAPVLLLDTVGELRGAYAGADIAFVGGSLVPKGGHNVLEPALYGVPTLVGPHMENFREIAGIFRAARALGEVAGADELSRELVRWAADPRPFAETGRRAASVLAGFRGASARNADLVARLVGASGAPAAAAAGTPGGPP